MIFVHIILMTLFMSIITSFTGSRVGYHRAYYTIYIYIYSEVGWIRRVDLPMGRLCLVWTHKELGLGYDGIMTCECWASVAPAHVSTGPRSPRLTCRHDALFVL